MEGTLALKIARLENHIRLLEKQEALNVKYNGSNVDIRREKLRLELQLYQLQDVINHEKNSH
jgi:hypothetical protein